jgi:hypothetical protein
VARGGDGGPGRLRLGEGDRTAVGRRSEPAGAGGEAAAQGGGGVAVETERVRGEKEG